MPALQLWWPGVRRQYLQKGPGSCYQVHHRSSCHSEHPSHSPVSCVFFSPWCCAGQISRCRSVVELLHFSFSYHTCVCFFMSHRFISIPVATFLCLCSALKLQSRAFGLCGHASISCLSFPIMVRSAETFTRHKVRCFAQSVSAKQTAHTTEVLNASKLYRFRLECLEFIQAELHPRLNTDLIRALQVRPGSRHGCISPSKPPPLSLRGSAAQGFIRKRQRALRS